MGKTIIALFLSLAVPGAASLSLCRLPETCDCGPACPMSGDQQAPCCEMSEAPDQDFAVTTATRLEYTQAAVEAPSFQDFEPAMFWITVIAAEESPPPFVPRTHSGLSPPLA
ncbi:MAG: hypothetical protein HYT79_04535 [Elusimicrobia bacterium]|nr:hypothetical protein [Elusimicrobiota bacterium]